MKMSKIVKTMLIAGVVFVCGVNAFAADDSGYALLVQSSPVDGGNIMPGNGVHKVQIGGKMQLTAIPKTGFRFLYWVGDVGQMGTSETTVDMDSPKLVIAVFVREQFDSLKVAGVIGGAATGGTYGSGGPGAGSRGYGTAIGYPDDDNPNIPQTPEENNEVPVPEIPEPATLLLFGSGAAALLARRHSKQLS